MSAMSGRDWRVPVLTYHASTVGGPDYAGNDHVAFASDLATATSLEQRLGLLPLVRSALDSSVAVTTSYVGYPNGDFFLVRRLRTESELIRMRAPEGAEYVVQSIERRRQPARGRHEHETHRNERTMDRLYYPAQA